MKSLPILLVAGIAWAEPHLDPDGSLVIDEQHRVMVAPGKGTVAVVPVEEHQVAWARVPLGKRKAAEAVVQLDPVETIFSGTTGPVGDGEREERLRVGESGVIRYQVAPTVKRCDGVDMLFPERWDFASHRFRPVEGEVPEGKILAPAKSAPADLLPEPLGLFHFSAASTSPDAERKADRLGAPHELEDGKTDTFWVAGPAGGGRGTWVTARAPSDEHRLRAVKVVPGPGWPKAITILVGREPFEVRLSGPQPVWVALPETLPVSCVSIVIAEPHPQGQDTSLAEVTLYTDVDVAGGLEQLVEAVASERAGAAGAEQVLVARGAQAAKAIAARLERSQEGRRRLLDALAKMNVPEAAAPLGKALETANANEREIVVEGLVRLKDTKEALRVYRDASQAQTARADAALILGEVGGDEAVEALVAGIGEVPLASLRALERMKNVEPRVAEALAGNSSCAPAVGLLARVIPGNPAVDAAWKRCANGDFPLKLRLVRSLKNQSLLAEAEKDPEPMIRESAVEAGGPALVSDPDPGVRRISMMRAQTGEIENALKGDSWPLVRKSAAEALGRKCGTSTNALASAVEKDASEAVRREALLALAHCGPVPTPLLAKILQSHEQPIAVRELAAALVAKNGGPATLIAEAIDDVLSDPAADERSASLAVACLHALGRLKSSERRVLEAIGNAANEPLSPAVRAAAMETIGEICPEGSGEALNKGKQDPEGTVRRAAQQALDKCKR